MRESKFVLHFCAACVISLFGSVLFPAVTVMAAGLASGTGDSDMSVVSSIGSLPELWYNGSVYVRQGILFIIAGSILLGCIVFNTFKRVPEVRHWALNLLILKIPIFAFMATYVYSFLYQMLNLSVAGDVHAVSSLARLWYNGSIYAKRWVPVIVVGSMLLGWIIYDIFKKVREIQKRAFDLLIIKTPIFTFVALYVYSFLYRYVLVWSN